MDGIKDHFTNLSVIRKYLHQYPEVSGEEYRTADYVARQLDEFSCTVETGIGGTGILATFTSPHPSGPVVAIRAELDALPIQEVNTFDYHSVYPEISHKCGHDGHMSILLGVAQWLDENPPQQGKVVLLFQPAEENGEGARAMLDDPAMQNFKPDFIYGLHNLPGYPMHQIVYKYDHFSAYVKSLIIRLYGKTAHAAEPEFGHNPALAIAKIIQEAEKFSNNQPERDDFAVITPVHINMGEQAYGISAGYGEIHFTLRTWSKEAMEQVDGPLLKKVQSIADEYKLKPEWDWTHEFHANKSRPEAVEHILKAAEALDYKPEKRKYPFKWGEDFGLFTQVYNGGFFGLGSGEQTPALHNPDYDFPDEIIETGVNMFKEIIKQHNYE